MRSSGTTGLLALAMGLGACVHGELDDVREARVGTHVEDWRDEIVYQLVVDRFANGDPSNDWRVDPTGEHLARYQGGDWQGVIDRLDYLDALGVTAIWISPIVLNVDTDAGVDGYHGYWQVDLERLNPHFGDLATLRRMVNACHERGIKVILDIVTNHMGQVFYYDININGRPDENVFGSGSRSRLERITEYDPDYDPRGIQASTSLGEAGPAPIRFFDMPEIFRVPPRPPIFQRGDAYNRRGRVTDWNLPDQVLYGDFPGGLKDIATENPDVREEMVRIFSDWALKLDLDGFRIDTLKHVENGFWEYFAPAVRERLAAAGKTNFLMFGEAFDGDDALVGSFTMPGRIDSVFYFPHKFQVFDDVFARGQPTAKVEALFAQRTTSYGTVPQEGGIGVPPSQALVSFIDNHDLPRFLFERDDVGALRAALGYLLTFDGIPCIYYGTEQDFAGGNDPANRELLWRGSHGAYDTTNETFLWIARLTRLRRELVALRRGALAFTWTSERTADDAAATDAGIIAFERTTPGGDYALVVVNAQGARASETAFGGESMAVTAAPGTTLVDRISGDTFTVAGDGTLRVPVPPHATRVLVAQ